MLRLASAAKAADARNVVNTREVVAVAVVRVPVVTTENSRPTEQSLRRPGVGRRHRRRVEVD